MHFRFSFMCTHRQFWCALLTHFGRITEKCGLFIFPSNEKKKLFINHFWIYVCLLTRANTCQARRLVTCIDGWKWFHSQLNHEFNFSFERFHSILFFRCSLLRYLFLLLSSLILTSGLMASKCGAESWKYCIVIPIMVYLQFPKRFPMFICIHGEIFSTWKETKPQQ